uniref:Protein kinase domain-containing protein n=1 Tax=Mycena chlorophos TaxID=658473 RepID=A0ABQ0L2U4_MYCCL|nr:predicted protein [Mycena chlorophos]
MSAHLRNSPSTPSLTHRSSSTHLNGFATARPLNHRPSHSNFRVDSVAPPSIKFQWVKGALIGQGSYGRVFLGMTTSGELLAVKQVETPQTPSDRASPKQREVVEALKFESKALQLLGDHPNIVQYLGFEETSTTLNIFLEYIPGGTIGSMLQKHGRFDQNVAKHFTRQIAAGLEYLHSKNVLHRDLKGENILVETSGVCKISDFGISRTLEAQHQAHTELKGTVYWMAPEVVDARKQGYGSKVDIWSLGCVLLEMWTGEHPWAGEEVIAVMLKLYKHKQPPPLPSDLRAELSESALDFHGECFAMDPNQRPSADMLLKHPYLNSLPLDWSFSLSDLERVTRKPRRRSKTGGRHRNSSVPATRRPSTSDAVPPLPSKSEATLRSSDYTRRPSIATVVIPPPTRPPPPAPAELPPIVVITPLPSSSRISSRSSSFSTTESTSSVSPQPTRKKRFLVANPDPTPEDRRAGRFRKPFVYEPPPLPSHPSPAAPASRAELMTRDERRLAPAVSMQNLTAPMSSSSTITSSQYDSDSDSDSYSTGMWKKPPETGPSKASKYAHRQSIIETKRETTWAPRPGVGDVYSHLEDFFPKVDLDKPMEQADRRRPKSIRMQAEDRLTQTGVQRRATRLWGHRVEEV